MFHSKYTQYIRNPVDDEDSAPFLEKPRQIEKLSLLRRISNYVVNWVKGSPFITIVSVVQIVTLIYSLILNHGFEPWDQNPMLGPSADILVRMGAKDVISINCNCNFCR